MAFRNFFHSSPKASHYSKLTKPYFSTKDTDIKNPPPIVFAVTSVERDSMKRDNIKRDSMKRDILNTLSRKSECVIEQGDGDNQIYEDPKDIIVQPPKPPRRCNLQPNVVSPSNDTKSLLKEQRRKLTKKYEGLITTLIEKCEESVAQMSEKESQITKLKEKLKTVLHYNKLFADENEQIKSQYETLVKYIEELKRALREERERSTQVEERCKELEERINKSEVPNREEATHSVPLVEVCMSCSRAQIALTQAQQQAARAHSDMKALKDVLYRLNLQLSRYQEKLRSMASDYKDPPYKPGGCDQLDSLLTTAKEADDERRSKSPEDGSRKVEISGLLSAQALAPLFDAYQENLQEKDSLILDYEKQFENINKKSKEIVSENKTLFEKVASLEDELAKVRQSYKKIAVEKETADIEKATLIERAERAEYKLKEVYECYEDKMSAMMRDYETVHREYFAVKNALEASEGKVAAIDVLRARTVPADLHERRLEHCKRLLEDLKHQYAMESERKAEHIKKLEEQLTTVQEKYHKLCQEHQTTKEELRTALKNVKLYRKAAQIFRHRLKAASARVNKVRRSLRSRNSEPLKRAVDTLERIKAEIKLVKSRASTSLEELEKRILEQERRAEIAHAEYRKEIERANIVLEHKEGIIRSLIDKVADVEEVRLSQTNTHRLQGIKSPEHQRKTKEPKVKLVPRHGGYYQDRQDTRSKEDLPPP